MQVVNKTQLKSEPEKGLVSLCSSGFFFYVLQHRADFSSANSPNGNLHPSSWKTGMRQKELGMDGKERRRGRKRKEKEDRRRTESKGKTSRDMERHKSTGGRVEPNKRRRGIGLRDETEGEAAPFFFPSLSLPREGVCIFFLVRSAALSFGHKVVPGTEGREGAGTRMCERDT